jgi:hypothetical protein
MDNNAVIFIDWNNHQIRKVLADDTVQTVVGWTDPVFPGDGVPGTAERSPTGVLGTDVQLNHPTDLAQTSDGKVLVVAWHNHKLREIDPATGTYASWPAVAILTATARRPPRCSNRRASLDAAGNMYILDQQNFRIRKIRRDRRGDARRQQRHAGLRQRGGLAINAG